MSNQNPNQEQNGKQQKGIQPTDKQPAPPRWGLITRFVWFFIMLTIVSWAWTFFGNSAMRDVAEINYSAFRTQLKAGNVQQVNITGERVQGTLAEPAPRSSTDEDQTEDGTATYTEFVTYLPSFGDERLLPLLELHEVEVKTQPETDFSWLLLIINLLPFILLIGLGFLFFSRMQAQGRQIFSVGQSRAKRYEHEKEKTTFDDVAGLRGAKAELQEIVEYLKDPEQVQRLGGEAPKGVLLVGPPGTGKTLLARAVAGEADTPFFSISGSDFMEMFVGVGASRVRSMFQQAKQEAPSIIFIDEIDSIGRRRGAGLGGGHDEREQTLNQLLSELDGFEPNESVIVMAATNRPDILDPALLRPGRFDRRITVNLPTLKSRWAILKIHAKNKPLAGNVDLEKVARGVPSFSGADLRNMLNEAALLAARENKNIIELDDIEEARDKILMGLEREGLTLTEEDCKLIAYHEAGHAVVAVLLPHTDPIHKVTIVPRGRAMGVTQQLPEREKYIYPENYLLDRLAVMMGGRAAEELEFGTVTSGAENDLKEATQLARKMVLDWGMSKQLGHIALGNGREQVFLGEEIAQRREYSEETAREVDQEITGILESAYERASCVLQNRRHALTNVAETLLKQEEMTGEEVIALIGDETIEEDCTDDQLDIHGKQIKVSQIF